MTPVVSRAKALIYQGIGGGLCFSLKLKSENDLKIEQYRVLSLTVCPFDTLGLGGLFEACFVSWIFHVFEGEGRRRRRQAVKTGWATARS